MTQDYQSVGNVPVGPYNAAVDRDANQVERQLVGIDFGAVVGSVWTPSKVSSTNPLPVTQAGSLIPVTYDYISLSYTGDNVTGVVYKTGGAGGTTVATLVITYSGSNILTVTRT